MVPLKIERRGGGADVEEPLTTNCAYGGQGPYPGTAEDCSSYEHASLDDANSNKADEPSFRDPSGDLLRLTLLLGAFLLFVGVLLLVILYM